MIFESILGKDETGRLWWKRKMEGRAKQVYRVVEVCRILKRSRRQVYRSLQSGDLKRCDRFLGELLVDAESVRQLTLRPPAVQPVPRGFQKFFPEYDIESLNVGQHRSLIVSRLLEEGGVADLRWLFRRYRKQEIKDFLREDGERLLGRRSFVLWSRVVSLPLPRKRRRRVGANPWTSGREDPGVR